MKINYQKLSNSIEGLSTGYMFFNFIRFGLFFDYISWPLFILYPIHWYYSYQYHISKNKKSLLLDRILIQFLSTYRLFRLLYYFSSTFYEWCFFILLLFIHINSSFGNIFVLYSIFLYTYLLNLFHYHSYHYGETFVWIMTCYLIKYYCFWKNYYCFEILLINIFHIFLGLQTKQEELLIREHLYQKDILLI